MIEKREGESITQFTMRKVRAAFLEEARDRLMSIIPDMSAIGQQHKEGFRAGHSAMRYAARDLINEMINE